MNLKQTSIEHMHHMLDKHWDENSLEPNLMHVIAKLRGRHPLEVGETMTVTFGHEQFEITRKLDVKSRKSKVTSDISDV